MNLNKDAKAALSKICEDKCLGRSEAILYLLDIYQLNRIEEIIEQIKIKHLNNEITAPQKAALRILATYIDVIC